jgi:hypothetical protein
MIALHLFFLRWRNNNCYWLIQQILFGKWCCYRSDFQQLCKKAKSCFHIDCLECMHYQIYIQASDVNKVCFYLNIYSEWEFGAEFDLNRIVRTSIYLESQIVFYVESFSLNCRGMSEHWIKFCSLSINTHWVSWFWSTILLPLMWSFNTGYLYPEIQKLLFC